MTLWAGPPRAPGHTHTGSTTVAPNHTTTDALSGHGAPSHVSMAVSLGSHNPARAINSNHWSPSQDARVREACLRAQLCIFASGLHDVARESAEAKWALRSPRPSAGPCCSSAIGERAPSFRPRARWGGRACRRASAPRPAGRIRALPSVQAGREGAAAGAIPRLLPLQPRKAEK